MKLDDLRRSFRVAPKVDPMPPKRGMRRVDVVETRYKIAIDGRDVLMKAGRYEGKTLRAVVEEGEPSYLRWILGCTSPPWPEDLRDVCTWLLREWFDDKDAFKAETARREEARLDAKKTGYADPGRLEWK